MGSIYIDGHLVSVGELLLCVSPDCLKTISTQYLVSVFGDHLTSKDILCNKCLQREITQTFQQPLRRNKKRFLRFKSDGMDTLKRRGALRKKAGNTSLRTIQEDLTL